MGVFGGELERVMYGNPVRSIGGRSAGGEWDYLRAVSPRVMRQLTGAGYFATWGEPPDVAAELIIARVLDCSTVDDAMHWYVTTARRALAERRIESHRARHLRIARQTGHPSYYARRVALARADGYPSLWARRRALGWRSGHEPDHEVLTWSETLELLRSG